MGNRKILIVDDENSVRKSLNIKLSREGYICEEVNGGEEALNHLTVSPADLIILDLLMPGKSGIEILPEIRTKYPDTAIVVITAINDPQMKTACLREGAQDYILKPFDLRDVISVISNVLAKRDAKATRDALSVS